MIEEVKKMAKYRTFEVNVQGRKVKKQFHDASGYMPKTKANKFAKEIRGEGDYARVVPAMYNGRQMYVVYVARGY